MKNNLNVLCNVFKLQVMTYPIINSIKINMNKKNKNIVLNRIHLLNTLNVH